MKERKKICFVVSSPLTARAFLSGHLAALSADYAVDLVADTTDPAQIGGVADRVRLRPVPIRRKISLWADFRALLQLIVQFRRERYVAVSSVTPKAGLLSLLAAFIARIPLRLHIFTGQVWATKTGLKRTLLKSADRLMAHLATHILTDSPSQREFLIAEGVVEGEKIRVLGEASICGVDGERFRPQLGRRAALRAEHGLPQEAVVFLYLGRLNRDKGVLDLADAFAAVEEPGAWLLIVGPDEEGLRGEMERRFGAAVERTRFVGYTDTPEDYMAAADVFCLPSYREGFGTVIIEAAATGLPAIASRIYGVTDAVVDGQTGLLHPARNVTAIHDAISALASDEARRLQLGHAARERALAVFSAVVITNAWRNYYGRLLD